MPAQNYVLLEKVTIGESLPSSITFSSIPQTGYTDLKMVISARGTYAAQYGQGSLTFNNSATGYSGKLIVNSSGTTVGSFLRSFILLANSIDFPKSFFGWISLFSEDISFIIKL